MASVGRYQLLQAIGEGGMGVVYKAFDPLLERTLAIKVISTRLDEVPDLRERFFSEARAAGRLSHKNIVTIYDLGEDNGQPYFAMELLEGRNLRVRMHSPLALTLARKLDIITQVCEGLSYAHAHGIIHRDIKPANLFIVGSGQIKILDFGLARLPNTDLTRSRTLLGTFDYMSPEQIEGEAIDHRVDIFAVGVVLYELLAERTPFKGDSVASVLQKILKEEPEPLDKINPQLPQALGAIVSRAIAKAREERYPNLNEMLIDLAACRAELQAVEHLSPAMLVALPESRPQRATSGDRDGGSADGGGVRPADPHPSGAPPKRDEPGWRSPESDAAGSAFGRASAPQILPAASSHGASTARSHSGAFRPRGLRRVGLSAAALLLLVVVGIGWRLLPAAVRHEEGQRAQQASATSGLRPPRANPSNDAAIAVGESGAAPQGTVGRQPAPPQPPTPAPEPGVAASERGTAEVAAQLTRAQAARSGAESVGAAELAGSSYANARAAEEAGRRLFEARKFAAARRRLEEAARLFANSETEARAARSRASDEAATREGLARDAANAARRACADERARAAAAGVERIAPAAFREADGRASEAQGRFDHGAWAEAEREFHAAAALFDDAIRLAGEASPGAAGRGSPIVGAGPPSAPLPSVRPAQPPASVDETAGAAQAIRETLGAYVAALESRSLAALKRAWPDLSGAQERAIRDEFAHASAISVGLTDPRIVVSGGTATVTCRRRYELQTDDGRRLQTDTQTTLTLRKSGSSWLIESVQYAR